MKTKIVEAGEKRYHWKFKYTAVLVFILFAAWLFAKGCGAWWAGVGFTASLGLLFALPDYIRWNRKYNQYLKEGRTEAVVRYLIAGGRRPLKVVRTREPEAADFRRFHFRKKHLVLAISCLSFCFMLSVVGGWWAGTILGMIIMPLGLLDYLKWNSSLRDALKEGYAEAEARIIAKAYNTSVCGGGGEDFAFDPMNSSCPGNIYHHD